MNYIQKTLDLFSADKQSKVTEIRIPFGKGAKTKTDSGYYNSENFGKIESDVKKYNGAKNIYFTFNEVEPACLSKCANRIKEYAETTTSAKQIIHRRWLLIDLDPEKPVKEISASDKEKKEAEILSQNVCSVLKSAFGFPNPIIADSGNGFHLWYKIDMENSDENTLLVETFLKTLAKQFDRDMVKIDQTVFDASRIIKLYGTKAVKGDNTEDRPHRMSKIIEVPKPIELLEKELIQKYIDTFETKKESTEKSPQEKKTTKKKNNIKSPTLLSDGKIEEWASKQGLNIINKKIESDGIYYILDVCPFDSEHGVDSAIIQKPDGKICFHCFHNGCAGKSWSDLRKLKEPDAYTNKESYQVKTANTSLYTYESFLEGIAPFEEVYKYIGDGFQLERAITEMAKIAQSVGVKNFKKLFTEYVKNIKKVNNQNYNANTTQFEGQAIELNCGEWTADEEGVSFEGAFGEVIACHHPILPVERLVNIDTGIEKLRVAYRKGRNWKSIISDKKTLASNNSIIDLANYGVSVTSETSKYLVKYLQDMENLNYNEIPEKNSVSRLGWIEGEGFSPYCGSLEFDGDQNFKSSFESVKPKGDFDVWKNVVKKGRAKSITTKIIVAASFASVLVKPLGGLPFFVHMWGGTEVGKTVGLMVAASVWANPEVGKFIQSFNSTVVGRERMAAFYNNMPLILDELQVIKDKKSFDHDIYTLCEGAGKVRGNKTGGTDQTPTWANCILSNGEMPITSSNSGGGAVNRIIDIECKEALFDELPEVANIVRKNHGFAGKEFVKYLQEPEIMDKLNLMYKEYYTLLSENDTTQKQSMAAAIILTADKVISELFFSDEALTVDGIKGFLQTKKEVSSNERAYYMLCDWVSQYSNKFQKSEKLNEESIENEKSIDIFGKIEEDKAYIINNVFNSVCQEFGFNSTAILSYFREKGYIIVGSKTTLTVRIKGIPTRCICLKMACDESLGETQCPF